MVTYVAGASAGGLVRTPPAQILAWRDSLDARIESLLAQEPSKDTQCLLLQFLGALRLLPEAVITGRALDEHIDAALDMWQRLLNDVPDAPLYPIDRFANVISVASVVLSEHPDYRNFTRRLDALVAERAGRASAAAKCRDRAMQFYKSDRYTAALRELHEARIDWFAGDTIRGSLLASMFVADCYDRLHLHMAAKYYWLSVGVLAIDLGNHELHDLAGTALLASAQSDYMQGSWFGFLDLVELGLVIHSKFDHQPMDFERHGILKHTLLSLAVIQKIGRRHLSTAQSMADSLLVRIGLRDDAEAVIGVVGADWSGITNEELAALIEAQLGHSAFSDAGTERTVSWRALGITWSVTFENSYETVGVAERFVAVAQILLVDLAESDLCLLPTRVSVRVTITDGNSDIVDLPSNDGRLWEIALRQYERGGQDAVQETQMDTLRMILTILREVSVLPKQELDALTSAVFSDGIVSKISPAKVYDSLYANCVGKEQFERSIRERGSSLLSDLDVMPPEHLELAWFDGPGPGYSRETAEEFLANRYERSGSMTRWTRVRLSASARFNALVAKLRAEGWLDWQILAALLAIAHHHRVYMGGPPTSEDDFKSRCERWDRDENPDWPTVPPEEFSEAALRRMRDANLLATLRVWGLESWQRTPDFRAIERFLTARYGYASDDIEHEDPFPEATEGYSGST